MQKLPEKPKHKNNILFSHSSPGVPGRHFFPHVLTSLSQTPTEDRAAKPLDLAFGPPPP